MKPTYCFTVDDNIRFLKELTATQPSNMLAHPYLAMYWRLHERFGVCVQLNLFYRCEDFNLSMMTDRYRDQWRANAHWLKLSFHSEWENVCPYESADYETVYGDCEAVHREILRFAGKESLASTTTVHYCVTTEQGLLALRDHGVKGLLGLFGTDDAPRTSYGFSMEDAAQIRNGKRLYKNGMAFAPLDIVLNRHGIGTVLKMLDGMQGRQEIHVMIHEQYFYADYHAYQPEFEEKLAKTFLWFSDHGYATSFLEQCIAEY